MIPGPIERCLKVGRELLAQLRPGTDGIGRQISEPGSGCWGQTYMQIIGHNKAVATQCSDGRRIDMEPIVWICLAVIFLNAD